MVPHGQRGLSDAAAVPDHVVVMLQLCPRRRRFVATVDDVKRLARYILTTNHRITLHALDSTIARVILGTDGPPAALLAVIVPRTLELCDIISVNDFLLAFAKVDLLTAIARCHSVFRVYVSRTTPWHANRIGTFFVTEVPTSPAFESRLLHRLFAHQGESRRSLSGLHGA